MSDRSWIATRTLRDAYWKKRAETMSRNEMIELTLHLHKATASAVLVSDDGDESRAVWLPQSKIEIDEYAEEGETTSIKVPEWLAQDEELV